MIIRNKNLHENILETGIVQKKQPKFFWILMEFLILNVINKHQATTYN